MIRVLSLVFDITVILEIFFLIKLLNQTFLKAKIIYICTYRRETKYRFFSCI